MNSAPGQKNRPWHARITIKNIESSAAMPIGSLVVLGATGTDDGYGYVLPSTAGAAKTNALGLGVACGAKISPSSSVAQINAGDYGDIIVAGWCQTTRLCKMTKSASSAAWASFPAGAVGDGLFGDTVNNCLVNIGSLASTAGHPIAVLCESYASATTVASGVYSTVVPLAATALTVNVKSWVRTLG